MFPKFCESLQQINGIRGGGGGKLGFIANGPEGRYSELGLASEAGRSRGTEPATCGI